MVFMQPFIKLNRSRKKPIAHTTWYCNTKGRRHYPILIEIEYEPNFEKNHQHICDGSFPICPIRSSSGHYARPA